MLRQLQLVAILGGMVLPWLSAENAAETDPPGARKGLTTAAQIRAQRNLAPNTDCPLSLTGVVTWVDAGRGLLVLQDDTGAVALHVGASAASVRPGRRVSLRAGASAPFVGGCPGYPYRPSGGAVLSSFETPQNEGDYRLTRMRAWLRPPVSGEYTFWISSDDSSELWLSPNAKPEEAGRVAMVASGNWTDFREWSRHSSQRSEKVHLQAGEAYYLEALHENMLVNCHLEVAWEGPGIERAVIDGKYLVPWARAPGAETAADRGVLRQFWTDYSAGGLAPVSSLNWAAGELAVDDVDVTVLGDGEWPVPLHVEPCQIIGQDDFFRWVEGEGTVGFIASQGTSMMLEIVSGQNRMRVQVADWKKPPPRRGQPLRAKFGGVCKGVRDSAGHLIAGVIWTPSGNDVSVIEDTGAPPPNSVDPSSAPISVDPTLGGFYFTRGVVTFSDRVLGKDCLFVQEAFGGVFISQAERRFQPPPQAGQCVEVGGNFLPRQFAPAIRPLSLNVLGWQSFPIPVTPSSEAEFRDGQWTEIEGVARAVNTDGTLLLSGRQADARMWIGGSEPAALERLVNCVLRVRGVMSLGNFDTPVLLVPSHEFVDVTESALELSSRPLPVASLGKPDPGSGWVRQVRIAGTVTYGNSRGFYLQDQSGGLHVELVRGDLPGIGSRIEVLGFPVGGDQEPRLTEAVWVSQSPGAMPDPVRLDPEVAGPSMDGVLVSVRARNLSQKQRGTDFVMELQADRHVFEAVLESAAGRTPGYETGSLLDVTGVCILDPGASSGSVRQVLLRSTSDIALLEGPPWWTWRRTAILIGVLIAVLVGSLLRIFMLNRRFVKQQAARLAFTRGMLESQEGERRRIAASLHDSLGQDLLVIRNQALMAIQSSEEKSDLRQRLEEISNTTLLAINDVREITHNLRPYQLDRLGLTQAIRAITCKVSDNCSLAFASHVDEIDGIFDNESEIHIYRIVQEGINNVLKHSRATEATVVVKSTPGGLSISIRDNGTGLADNGVSAAGFGLSGIRERAGILGGTARIDSLPGQGVNLQVQLPRQTATKCETESKF